MSFLQDAAAAGKTLQGDMYGGIDSATGLTKGTAQNYGQLATQLGNDNKANLAQVQNSMQPAQVPQAQPSMTSPQQTPAGTLPQNMFSNLYKQYRGM